MSKKGGRSNLHQQHQHMGERKEEKSDLRQEHMGGYRSALGSFLSFNKLPKEVSK